MLLQCLHSQKGENSGVLFHLVAILAAIPKPPSHTQSNLPVSTTRILPAELTQQSDRTKNQPVPDILQMPVR